MAVISGSDYQTIASNYANGYSGQVASKQYYYDAVYNIVLMDSIEPEVDLLTVFYDTYSVVTDTLASTASLLAAVRALNNHVVTRGGYADVDAFLDAAGITVSQTWADLSADAGYTISNTYIA